jgi:hypothetical protein
MELLIGKVLTMEIIFGKSIELLISKSIFEGSL